MFVRGQRPDFGSLGDTSSVADVKEVVNVAKDVKGAAGEGGGCMDGMCGCKSQSNAAKAAKQAEIQKANPAPIGADGKPIPEDSAQCDAACKAVYQRQREQLAAWEHNEDLKASLKLPANVKEGFVFAAELGTALKEVLPPEAGQMSLQQIAVKYPKETAAVYAQVAKKYPNLANVPLLSLLAGSPDIAAMKLDDAIARASTLGGVPPKAPTLDSVLKKIPGGAAGAGIGLLFAGAVGYFLFRGNKKG